MISSRQNRVFRDNEQTVARLDKHADCPWLYREILARQTRRAKTLHELVACGGIGPDEIIKQIIKDGVNIRDSFGRTPAMLCGHSFYLDVLLEHGADPLAKDLAGNTLLMYYWPHQAQRLIELGVDINAKNIFGHTLFYFAVKNSWDVSPLIELGANWEPIPADMQDSFFIDNVYHNRSIVVLSHIVRNYIPSETAFNTARIWAAMHSPKMFDWLGSLCCKYKKTTVRHLRPEQINDLKSVLSNFGCDCLPRVLSCLESQEDIRKLISETNSPTESLLRGDMPGEQLELLLRLGADPNQGVNWKDNTDVIPPLFDAVWNNCSANVELLLFYGANASTGTTYMDTDCTCLEAAVAKNNESILNMLIRAGADLDMSLRGNRTPLITAIRQNNKRFVKILLEAGADPSVSYEKGKTITDYFDILNCEPASPEIRRMILDALEKKP